MDWFGIAIIVIPCVGIVAFTAEQVMYSRKLRAWAKAQARPPRARSIRATYGPGYHPVLNWNWDEAYDGWWNGGSAAALRLILSPTFRRVGYHMDLYAQAWRSIAFNLSRVDQGVDFSIPKTITFKEPWK